MWVQCKALSNKDITIIKVVSHMKYIDIKLVCPITYGKSKQIQYRSYIEMGNKRSRIDIVNYVQKKN